eukprot:220861_1
MSYYSNDSDNSGSDRECSPSAERISSCRFGAGCRHVKYGQCNYWHPRCKYGVQCQDLEDRDCGFYHPQWEFNQTTNNGSSNNNNVRSQSRSRSRSRSRNRERQSPNKNININENQLSINDQLKNQNDTLKKELVETKHKLAKIECELNQMNGNNLNNVKSCELLEIESKLNNALQKVRQKINDIHQKEKQCVVCMDQKKNMLFRPCNHVAVCQTCHLQLKECPLCQKPITESILIYL